jgi:hypothetical protein
MTLLDAARSYKDFGYKEVSLRTILEAGLSDGD